MRYFAHFLAFVVLCYSLGLLLYVGTDPQPGIHCLLRGNGSQRPRIAVSEALDYRGQRPRTGDELVAVGGQNVPTFVHFHRRFTEISRQPSVQVAVVDVAESQWPPVWDDASGRWVRIDFLRDDAAAHTWVRLKTPQRSTLLVSWAWFILEMLIFSIGAFVALRRPGDRSAVLFYVLCAVQVVMFLGAFHWPSLVDTRLLLYPFLVSALMLAPVMLHFHVLFPRAPAIARRWPRRTLMAIYGLPCLWLVLMFVCFGRMTWMYEMGAAPDALRGQLRFFTVLMYAYLAISLVMFLASQALLVRHFLRSRTLAERNQVKWLLASMFVGVWPVGYLLYTSTWQPEEFIFGFRSKVMLYAASAVFALGYAVSITRYKLKQASRIVDRGLVYVAISFAATAVFCALVGLGTMLVGRYYFSWENAAAAGVTAMFVVILLGWLRDRFQRALDRRFHQQKYQLDKSMARLSEAVDQLVEPAQLAQQLLQSAREAVRAERGAVYLRDVSSGRHELVAWTGWPALRPPQTLEDPRALELSRWQSKPRELATVSGVSVIPRPGDAHHVSLTLPLELDGDAVGVMLLGPRQDATAYTTEDEAFLAALVQTAALALRSARGHRTIEALRQELQVKVEKIAEQQQRIHFLQSELLNRAEPAPVANRVSLPPRETGAPPARLASRASRELLGSSMALRGLLEQAAKVARSSSSVLIRGESGTGKELLAQSIHEQSTRASGPFVAVHCAALSAGLLESELFGHVRGAFTGADRDKTGRFELADQGTLFLDEIGDINPETQTKLLRVLQERAFERVGGTQTIQVNVRLIAATHQDLESLIREGRFREDLYYRLNVISLRCPALRERREDIFELALQFLRRYAAEAGKSIVRLEEDALDALLAYSWPGNIRQLENAVQRAVVLADGDALRRSDLPPEVLCPETPAPAMPRREFKSRRRSRIPATVSASSGSSVALDVVLDGVERERLTDAIARAEGNKAAAARLLGLPRSTFFSKLRKHGLD